MTINESNAETANAVKKRVQTARRDFDTEIAVSNFKETKTLVTETKVSIKTYLVNSSASIIWRSITRLAKAKACDKRVEKVKKLTL